LKIAGTLAQNGVVERSGNGLRVSVLSLKDRQRIGKAGAGEKRGKYAIPYGHRLRRPFCGRHLGALANLRQRVRVAPGDRQGIGEHRHVQPKQLSGGGGRRVLRADGCAVPTVPLVRRDCVAQPDFELVTGDEANQEILARRALNLGDCQGRSDIDAAMVGPPQGDVIIVVEIAQRHGVQECRLIARNLSSDAEDCRLRISSLHRDNLLRHLHGFGPDRAERATDRVKQHPLGPCDHISRQLFEAKVYHPARYVFCHGGPIADTLGIRIPGCRRLRARSCAEPSRQCQREGSDAETQDIATRQRLRTPSKSLTQAIPLAIGLDILPRSRQRLTGGLSARQQQASDLSSIGVSIRASRWQGGLPCRIAPGAPRLMIDTLADSASPPIKLIQLRCPSAFAGAHSGRR
jgi:hypothetical protein